MIKSASSRFFDCLRSRDLFAIYLAGFPKIFEELRKRIRDPFLLSGFRI
jgi:hypothetical protein